MSKHTNIVEWVQDFVTTTDLTFETIEANPGFRALVPVYGDYKVTEDILGTQTRNYDFAFVGYEQLDFGTSTQNTANMDYFDSFIEWLELQDKNKNFPDLGGTDYEIIPLQNMANLALVDENGLAKYIFQARIQYKKGI